MKIEDIKPVATCDVGHNHYPNGLYTQSQMIEFAKPYKDLLEEIYNEISQMASPIGVMEAYPNSDEANYAEYFISEKADNIFNKLDDFLKEE